MANDSGGGFFKYLETLPRDSLTRLYGGSKKADPRTHSPWACQAILQSLPPLTKMYIMRFLCIKGPVEIGTVKDWVNERSISSHRAAIKKLRSLHILVDVTTSPPRPPSSSSSSPGGDSTGGQQGQGQGGTGDQRRRTPPPAAPGRNLVDLNPAFRANLQMALYSGRATPWQEERQKYLKRDRKPPTPAVLQRHMQSRWDQVLHFLVGSTALPDPPEEVIGFLVNTGLMQEDRAEGTMNITNRGYEFMLKDMSLQVWMTVQEYLRLCMRSGKQQGREQHDELLAFLLLLSFCRLGEDYPTAALTPNQKKVVKDFANFGLVFQRNSTSTRFYPTPLGIGLVSGTTTEGIPEYSREGGVLSSPTAGNNINASLGHSSTAMQLIVETNYQVVIYTSSPLHLAMVSLFVELRLRMPNMAIGSITRDSIRAALDTGIAARQILDFLRTHAHTNLRKKSPIIPENIADQIMLWERERSRVDYKEGVLIDLHTITQDEFNHVVKYTNQIGANLWLNMNSRKIVIPPFSVDKVKKFVQALSS